MKNKIMIIWLGLCILSFFVNPPRKREEEPKVITKEQVIYDASRYAGEKEEAQLQPVIVEKYNFEILEPIKSKDGEIRLYGSESRVVYKMDNAGRLVPEMNGDVYIKYVNY